MIDPFEDHCWQDVIPPEVLELYSHYKRPVGLGRNVALLAIDLYELAYQGGPFPVADVSKKYPSSCGERAWEAIPPTQKLFEVARAATCPIFYSTGETRSDFRPGAIQATNRNRSRLDPTVYDIRQEFAPQDGDVVIRKQRASAFYGTPLQAHLTLMGIDTVIVCGESTSGCVRATTVDGYSAGFKMVLAEECCFDRSDLIHKINLFDLHHKYADVLHLDEIVAALAGRQEN